MYFNEAKRYDCLWISALSFFFFSDGSYDVSGHPDPYMDHHQQQLQQDYKPQLNFDESLESGYSTPNSRNRRVIREIIV